MSSPPYTATVADIPLISPTLLAKFPRCGPTPWDRNENCNVHLKNFIPFFDESRGHPQLGGRAARDRPLRGLRAERAPGPRRRGGGDGGHRRVRQPRAVRARPRRGGRARARAPRAVLGGSAPRRSPGPWRSGCGRCSRPGWASPPTTCPWTPTPRSATTRSSPTASGATAASPSPRWESRRASPATESRAGELFERVRTLDGARAARLRRRARARADDRDRLRRRRGRAGRRRRRRARRLPHRRAQGAGHGGTAREAGVHFIGAGHYATETFGIRRLGELAAERFGLSPRVHRCAEPGLKPPGFPLFAGVDLSPSGRGGIPLDERSIGGVHRWRFT